MRFLDADPAAEIVGLEPLPGVSNYLVGNDPRNWRTGIPQYARVEYRDVYPGVDLAFHGDARALEYDFVVAPGADPGAIRLAFDGVTGLRLDARRQPRPRGRGRRGGRPEGAGELPGDGGSRRTPVRASYVVQRRLRGGLRRRLATTAAGRW